MSSIASTTAEPSAPDGAPAPADRVSDSRVFISYRRADGLFAVGWLAERLSRLDEVTGVDTAFHDSTLRAGADLEHELDVELRSCDLMLAVITHEWRGERPDGSVRIMDGDDWIVKEIRAALDREITIMPILVDGAEHPLRSEIHESIADLNSAVSKPFRDQADLEVIVGHVATHLERVSDERAQLAGLDRQVTVPKLARPGLIATAAVVLGGLLALLMWWATSGGVTPASAPCEQTRCVQQTTAYRVLEWWMPAVGLGCGVLAAVGGALALRIHRHARLNWWAIASIAAGMAVCLLLLSIAARSGHASLADVVGLPDPWWRFSANGLAAFLGATGLIVCLLAPIYSAIRHDPDLISSRVVYLAITRDAERWAAALLSLLFAAIGGAGAILVLAFRQSDADLDASPLPNLTFALVFSMMLIVVHNWSFTRLADIQAAIDVDLRPFDPRHRANAEPRLEAAAFDAGGWGFRVFLALPLIVAAVTTLLFTVV